MTFHWLLRQRDYATCKARRHDFRALLQKRDKSEHVGDHELVFGELVTNAARYGEDPMSVDVTFSGLTVLICVENSGNCFKLGERLLQLPTPEGGRGLRIVSALAKEFKVEHSSHECRVSALLSLDRGVTCQDDAVRATVVNAV